MTKTKKQATKDEQTSTFPVPFSLDAFRKDIVEVFFHYVRTIGWITDDKTAWRITGLEPLANSSYVFFSPEFSAAELGLRYEHIRDIPFAKALEHLYEFAFFGRRDANAEIMESESYYAWLSDLVSDALNGDVTEQWDSYGATIRDHAKNCVLVAETANARNILEGGEPFSYFRHETRGETPSEGVLSVRQMALLSGMEEMSIRAAANPKRANPLKTHTEDGGTRVATGIAKEWLQSKGRYIPVTIYRSAGDVDLSKRGFAGYEDLWFALNARCLMIADRDGVDIVKKKLEALGLGFDRGVNDYLSIEDVDYANEQLMKSFAELLELPADLLVLRCKETVANEQLAEVGRQLQETVLAAKNINSN